MNRNIEDVNCVTDVETMNALHMPLPKVQLPMWIVVIRNGRPIRKHISAKAKLSMNMFVIVWGERRWVGVYLEKLSFPN